MDYLADQLVLLMIRLRIAKNQVERRQDFPVVFQRLVDESRDIWPPFGDGWGLKESNEVGIGVSCFVHQQVVGFLDSCTVFLVCWYEFVQFREVSRGY